MIYQVKLVSGFKCSVKVPGSKSITNRSLIIGAFAEGKTILKNVLFSDDTRYMINALKTLGFKIKVDEEEDIVEIIGGKKEFLKGECFVGNAGTAMRFLPSFISAIGGEVELTGSKRMHERPIGELAEILRQLGAKINCKNVEGYPPILISACGLGGGNLKVKGNISSQFISSILLSAPYAKSDICIEIQEELVSKPYIDITLKMMHDFGIQVDNYKYKSFYIKAGQKYKNKEYIIESDCSSASYFLGAAAISNGDITIENINPDSMQGDIKFIDILEKMGVKIEKGQNYIRVIGSKLKGICIDMNNMSDVVQTLAVVALFAEGKTEIKNVYNMRLKETDRLKALSNELTKIGAEVIEKNDGLVIIPTMNYKGVDIDTYDDHRMAMSFSLAGLKIPGIKIKNSECVSKTFPKFYKEFEKIYE